MGTLIRQPRRVDLPLQSSGDWSDKNPSPRSAPVVSCDRRYSEKRSSFQGSASLL
jgi:hypothetical protein